MSQVLKYSQANVSIPLYTISCSNPHKHLLIALGPKDAISTRMSFMCRYQGKSNSLPSCIQLGRELDLHVLQKRICYFDNYIFHHAELQDTIIVPHDTVHME